MVDKQNVDVLTTDKNNSLFGTLHPSSGKKRLNQTPTAHVQGSDSLSSRAHDNATSASMHIASFSQYAMSPTLPVSGGLARECPLTELSLNTMPTDYIEWKFEYSNCQLATVYQWRIKVPQNYALVLEFNYIDMKRKDTLMVSSQAAGGTVEKLFRIIDDIKPIRKDESIAPLFVYQSEVLIVIVTFDEQAYRETTHLRISYTAYLNKSLPDSVYMFDNHSGESSTLYFCTGFDLPEAIMCDGIRHCEHGEDEVNCSYRAQGCGEWFPHGDQCLKAIFSPSPNKSVSPFETEHKCQLEYGATLALLPNASSVQIAAGLIRASGFLNAVVGLKKVKVATTKMKHLYKYLWQWGDSGSPVDFEHPYLQRVGASFDCAVLFVRPQPRFKPLKCVLPEAASHGFICMRPNPTRVSRSYKLQHLALPASKPKPDMFPTKECSDGSLVHPFHPCQWLEQDIASTGNQWSPGGLPLFQCVYGTAIHYSLLCDGLEDCLDGSDEIGCHQLKYPPLQETSYICKRFQTVPVNQTCDGKTDCFDGTDEEYCFTCPHGFIKCPFKECLPSIYASFIQSCPLTDFVQEVPPWQQATGGYVKLDGFGMSELLLGDCPEGFYKCQSGLCIPSFLLNNGETDCWDGDDEDIPIHNMTCPGYYRCQDVGICVQKQYLCDGIYHCPNKDDERFCHLTCPSDRGCACEGLAFTCSKMIDPLQHLHLRYLDVSYAVNVSLENIHTMEHLAFLNLSFCFIGNITLADMPQLQTLDLRFNALTQIVSLNLYKLPRLIYIDLSDNLFLHTIDSVFKTWLNVGGFKNLQTLIMTNVSLDTMDENVLNPLHKLEYLDIRCNPVHDFKKDSLQGLSSLKQLYTEKSKLCCSYFHSSLPQCFAPEDELSTCSDLLGEDFFRLFLWIFSLIAVAGNIGVFLYRQSKDILTKPSAHSCFVKNLCISDFLMGVYMVIIGVADSQFRGHYVAEERKWMNSIACQAAGFLSFVSSEVSAFVICFITLERVLVICFPFKAHIHIYFDVSILICCMIWLVNLSLAVVPLITGMEFYGQNGICIPLPITRHQFTGQNYAFSIFIILNFIIFLFIAVGQVLIYGAIQQARAAARSGHRGKDLTIARRLLLIVLTDFCCWFPIGTMGLLAQGGVPIPGRVNVWAAIFVMPLNSALNPFMYTLNELINQWKKRRMEKRVKRMLCKLEMDIPKWDAANISKLVKICVQCKVVQKDTMMKWMGIRRDTQSPSSSLEEAMVNELDPI